MQYTRDRALENIERANQSLNELPASPYKAALAELGEHVLARAS